MQLQRFQHKYESTIRRQQYTPEMLDIRKLRSRAINDIIPFKFIPGVRFTQCSLASARSRKCHDQNDMIIIKHLCSCHHAAAHNYIHMYVQRIVYYIVFEPFVFRGEY